MTFDPHPYGRPYFHIPTGKVIFLQNKYSDGSYSAHYQYKESMIVRPEDLRLPMSEEVKKDYPL